MTPKGVMSLMSLTTTFGKGSLVEDVASRRHGVEIFPIRTASFPCPKSTARTFVHSPFQYM